MVETGVINRDLARELATLGHRDELIVCDAGFAIPRGPSVVDISLDENIPTVDDIVETLAKVFSIEAATVANETEATNPSKIGGWKALLGPDVAFELVPHDELKARASGVKLVIRSGDFTAFSNLLLVSGAGNRWFLEKELE